MRASHLLVSPRHCAAVLKYFLGEIDRKQKRNKMQRLHKMHMAVSKLRLLFWLSSVQLSVGKGKGRVRHQGTFNSIFPIQL